MALLGDDTAPIAGLDRRCKEAVLPARLRNHDRTMIVFLNDPAMILAGPSSVVIVNLQHDAND